MMQYPLTKLTMKALESEHALRNSHKREKNTLKSRAMQSEKEYQSIRREKKKKLTQVDFQSFGSDIVSSASGDMLQEQEKQAKKPVLQAQINNRGDDKCLPSLYKCAELLKERVHLITYGDSLYYFNGKCYDLVVGNDIISLYRAKVDDKVGNEKNLNGIGQLQKFLCTDSTIAVEEFKNNKRIVVLRNGIYDVIKEVLKPHTHKEIVFSYINADYVENEKCNHFDKFLYDVTEGNDVLQERLWMFLGYTIMQTTEAKAFFVMGEAPDSGKSLLGNFIESLFPKKYVSNIALTDFNKSFSVAPIAGSAVNISLDLPSSRLNAVAVSKLKMLTGGDAFNINQKYVPEYRYENRAKLIFASNFPISLAEQDNAFWNRLVYLPFNKSIPKAKQNRELAEKFQEEKNAIVTKALGYAKKLVLSDFQFPSTLEIERKMQEWQGRSCATIENFLSECCDCRQEYRGELVDNLYSAYENYCEDTGYVAKSRFVFKQYLEQQIGLKHFKMRDGGENPQSAFRGIQLYGGIADGN